MKLVCVLLGFAIVAMIALSGYLYFFPAKNIQVVNNSKYFKLSNTNEKSALDKLLKEWKFFTRTDIRINSSTQVFSVKKIEIITTDEPQKTYIRHNSKDNIVLASSSVVIKNGVYMILLYINPKVFALNYKQDFINGLAEEMIITPLYASTHITSSSQDRFNKVLSVRKSFNRDNKSSIFTIEQIR